MLTCEVPYRIVQTGHYLAPEQYLSKLAKIVMVYVIALVFVLKPILRETDFLSTKQTVWQNSIACQGRRGRFIFYNCMWYFAWFCATFCMIMNNDSTAVYLQLKSIRIVSEQSYFFVTKLPYKLACSCTLFFNWLFP